MSQSLAGFLRKTPIWIWKASVWERCTWTFGERETTGLLLTHKQLEMRASCLLLHYNARGGETFSFHEEGFSSLPRGFLQQSTHALCTHLLITSAIIVNLKKTHLAIYVYMPFSVPVKKLVKVLQLWKESRHGQIPNILVHCLCLQIHYHVWRCACTYCWQNRLASEAHLQLVWKKNGSGQTVGKRWMRKQKKRCLICTVAYIYHGHGQFITFL